MAKMSEPSIEDYDGNSYTKISFEPDYKRFNMARMSPDMLSILKRRVYDISGITKVSVYLNNKLVQIPNFKSYVKNYL
jgi:DNA topoisomerase-2